MGRGKISEWEELSLCPSNISVLTSPEMLLVLISSLLKHKRGASLVVQWLRVCPLMRGTRVQSLVQEDPMCLGATKPESCIYWVHMLQLASPCAQSLCSAAREATAMRSKCTVVKSSPCLQRWIPSASKKTKKKKTNMRGKRWELSKTLGC